MKALILFLLLCSPLFAYDRLAYYGDKIPPVDANKEMIDVYHKLTVHRHILDSLGVKSDSIAGRQIFFAYDSVGGQAIPTIESRNIQFDTEICKDAIYTHTSDSSTVALNADGRYRLRAQASVEADTPSDVLWVLYFYIYTKDVWYPIPGGQLWGHSGSSYSLYSSLSLESIGEFDSGDSVRVTIYCGQGDDITTVAGTVSLQIEKID